MEGSEKPKKIWILRIWIRIPEHLFKRFVPLLWQNRISMFCTLLCNRYNFELLGTKRFFIYTPPSNPSSAKRDKVINISVNTLPKILQVFAPLFFLNKSGFLFFSSIRILSREDKTGRKAFSLYLSGKCIKIKLLE
jgi:hypothetical protein